MPQTDPASTAGPAATAGGIAIVATTAAGRRAAATLIAAMPERARLVEAGSAAEGLREAWGTADAIVAFLAAGAVVRVLAPLLVDKHDDPGVVVVDEACRHAVALLGGHGGGANDLAAEVAGVLGASPVVTTASDSVGVPGLDTLGWPVAGAVATVGRAMLDGAPVTLVSDATWPLPALPENVVRAVPCELVPDGPLTGEPVTGPQIMITDRLVEADRETVVLRPPSLVVGVGASRGVSVEEIMILISSALGSAGLSIDSVACLATAEVKADEPGLLEAAGRLGVPLVTHPASALAEVEVPNPSEVVRSAVATPSVAEAAARLGNGTCPRLGDLVVAKRTLGSVMSGSVMSGSEAAGSDPTVPMATVAVARHRPRGRLSLVSLGPGARDLLPERAVAALRASSVVVGLDQYVDQVRDLLRPGTRTITNGMGGEQQRAKAAVDEAMAGNAVAMVGSGDVSVYAMASPTLEYVDETVEVEVVPGITASLAAAAMLGAPLGNDHAVISLSDLHTPWEMIERRVMAAAAGDFAVAFYNPRSKGRQWQLPKALEILSQYRGPDTPVGVVRNASRPDQSVTLSTLRDLDLEIVDMYCLVVVGSTQTKAAAGRMLTPRGYRWQQ